MFDFFKNFGLCKVHEEDKTNDANNSDASGGEDKSEGGGGGGGGDDKNKQDNTTMQIMKNVENKYLDIKIKLKKEIVNI